ncbi:MAG: SRPBCC family protein [Angustibacter sp.]
MAQIPQSSVHIAQSAPNIVRIIADLENYPQWDSAIRSVSVLGRGSEDRPTLARFTLAQAGPISGYTLAYHWDVDPAGQGRISWRLAEQESILRAVDGSYLLAGSEPTEVSYELAFELKGRLLGALAKQAAGHIARSALAGLKARAEDPC